jgi:creatinine amidohydrolase/Fe(II)-dependent formamide hydrolase-like protein
METAPKGIAPTIPPDTVFIDELTWEETRDLMLAGKTTVIIPTGGTEKNGYHMTLGKHNVIVTFAANLMARKMGNALVAPTIQYVPEGNPDRQNAGAISLPSPAYDQLLDAAARSLKVHGFKEIIFIGDSGGNQSGMAAVAKTLNEEWKGQNVKVFGLVDYYEQGRVDYRDWMLKELKYTDQMVGSHAGISDTSQLLYVKPAAVRKNWIQPVGRSRRLRRVRRSDEGDGRNRKEGHRVQDRRGAAAVSGAQEAVERRREHFTRSHGGHGGRFFGLPRRGRRDGADADGL